MIRSGMTVMFREELWEVLLPPYMVAQTRTGPGLIRKVPPIRAPLMIMIKGQLAYGPGRFDHA
jgi:hypothetical protein